MEAVDITDMDDTFIIMIKNTIEGLVWIFNAYTNFSSTQRDQAIFILDGGFDVDKSQLSRAIIASLIAQRADVSDLIGFCTALETAYTIANRILKERSVVLAVPKAERDNIRQLARIRCSLHLTHPHLQHDEADALLELLRLMAEGQYNTIMDIEAFGSNKETLLDLAEIRKAPVASTLQMPARKKKYKRRRTGAKVRVQRKMQSSKYSWVKKRIRETMTQEAFAEIIGVSYSDLSRALTGKAATGRQGAICDAVAKLDESAGIETITAAVLSALEPHPKAVRQRKGA